MGSRESRPKRTVKRKSSEVEKQSEVRNADPALGFDVEELERRPRREGVASVQEARPLVEREVARATELAEDVSKKPKKLQAMADKVKQSVWTYELEMDALEKCSCNCSDDDLEILRDYIVQVLTGHLLAQSRFFEDGFDESFSRVALGAAFVDWVSNSEDKFADPHLAEIHRSLSPHSLSCIGFVILKAGLLVLERLENRQSLQSLNLDKLDGAEERREIHELLAELCPLEEVEEMLHHKGCSGEFVDDLDDLEEIISRPDFWEDEEGMDCA